MKIAFIGGVVVESADQQIPALRVYEGASEICAALIARARSREQRG